MTSAVASMPPTPGQFSFWVDELLWSQGKLAVELIEQLLLQMQGIRTGDDAFAFLSICTDSSPFYIVYTTYYIFCKPTNLSVHKNRWPT